MSAAGRSRPGDRADHWLELFLAVTDERADAVYASSGDRELTYGELRESVDRLASALLDRGVRPGEILAVWMTNGLELPVAQWATYRLGCALLPLYSYYREAEIEHALSESRATVLFTSRDFAGKADPRATLLGLLPELERESPSFAACPDLQLVVGGGDFDLPGVTPTADLIADAQLRPEGLEWVRSRRSPFDLMNVMYTSGTTGVPKAGMALHSNNLATVRHWSELAGLGEDDVILAHVPMFTNFGGLYTNGLALYNGCRMEVARTFDAGESVRLIGERGVTYVPGTPEIFRMLIDHPDFPSTDSSRVRAAHVAGSRLEPELMRRIIDELAPNAMQAYGMSECGGLSTATSERDPIERRLESVGRPIPSARVRIVDPETGAERPAGEVGEIWFGDAEPGSCVGRGYLASPEATAVAITPSGWFRSGDLGRLDEDGYLYFAGRLKNMITVGGFNVYPAEVERHLTAHEAVAAAHCVGVPDGRLGTVPVAFVLLEPGSETRVEALVGFMAERVSSQKRPRAIWIVDEDEIPLTPAGKVRLVELEQRAAKLVCAASLR